jgi:hypothetical protein
VRQAAFLPAAIGLNRSPQARGSDFEWIAWGRLGSEGIGRKQIPSRQRVAAQCGRKVTLLGHVMSRA